jgi:hypothetical protein
VATTPSPAESRVFGPEYGPEAIRRHRAGFDIAYFENGLQVLEKPDGRRFEVRLEHDGSKTLLREI